MEQHLSAYPENENLSVVCAYHKILIRYRTDMAIYVYTYIYTSIYIYIFPKYVAKQMGFLPVLKNWL